jgi:hypothetical protein
MSPHNNCNLILNHSRRRDNSTGINWRRLPTTSINEHYLTEYPGLTNQEIALRETLEEVERRVIEHELDLDRIDNPGLQESYRRRPERHLGNTPLVHSFFIIPILLIE